MTSEGKCKPKSVRNIELCHVEKKAVFSSLLVGALSKSAAARLTLGACVMWVTYPGARLPGRGHRVCCLPPECPGMS